VLEPTSSEVGEGWYATGDVVKVEDGFVSIVDRIKRFAKVAGEMVSLSVVEKLAERAAEGMHAVTTQVDPNKGEALVLYTVSKSIKRDAMSAAAREMGVSELHVPRKIVVVDALPLLGTGKTDYVTLKRMAEAA
jgi:acyl-[acyl-carrier-protein]-phospholipid O-acyltransferase/long-chain-fatty-acid--[acyl-carrier-protein] ligase